MNRFLKLIIISVMVVLVSSLFVLPSSADEGKVIYVSSDGRGDGSTPEKPIGNAGGYAIENGKDTSNAFYRALDKLKDTGGTVVVVGELSIDVTETRVPKSKTDRQAPCEFRCPTFANGKKITLTSVYNGVDYREKGAKFILDHDKCNTSLFIFECDALIENINIEYVYDPTSMNSYESPFMLGGGAHNFTIGEGVNVTSYDVVKGGEGELYPVLIGGYRYKKTGRSTNITVKSGKWSTVIAGSFGNSGDYGQVDGDANLTVTGGEIKVIIGTGSFERPTAVVKGQVRINVIGGAVEYIYATNQKAFIGRDITVNVSENAKLRSFEYAPLDYQGDIDELKSKVTVVNNSKPYDEPKEEENKQQGGPVLNEDGDIGTPPTPEEDIYDKLTGEFIKIILVLCAVVSVGGIGIYFLKLFIVKHK